MNMLEDTNATKLWNSGHARCIGKIMVVQMRDKGHIYVTGSRLLSYRKNTWLRTVCCLQIIWWENKKFQQRSWSATIPHREDMVQAGCD